MAIMTKMTEIVTQLTGNNPEYMDAYHQKLSEMQSAGKTDGVVENPTPNTFVRFWVDQQSAQDWIDWVGTNLALIDMQYDSAVIRDI